VNEAPKWLAEDPETRFVPLPKWYKHDVLVRDGKAWVAPEGVQFNDAIKESDGPLWWAWQEMRVRMLNPGLKRRSKLIPRDLDSLYLYIERECTVGIWVDGSQRTHCVYPRYGVKPKQCPACHGHGRIGELIREDSVKEIIVVLEGYSTKDFIRMLKNYWRNPKQNAYAIRAISKDGERWDVMRSE